MRILMLTQNCAGIGGSFMRAWSLARALARYGDQVTLLASRTRAGIRTLRTTRDQVMVSQSADIFPRRWRHAGLSPQDTLARVLYVKRMAQDVVYGFEHRPAVALPAVWRGSGCFVSDWADLWGSPGWACEVQGCFRNALGRWDGRQENKLRSRADGVTAISRYLARQAVGLGIPADRLLIVPPGANSDRIMPLPMAEMRGKFALPLDVPLVVYIGFAAHDAFFLAQALAEMVKMEPALMLVYAGRRLEFFERFAAARGLAAHVRYLGFLPYDSLAEALACGDVMLLPMSQSPANQARFPNRFGDYLSAGKPIAMTAVGDLADIIESENIGSVAAADPRSFAASVLELLGQPAMRLEMGQRARYLAETRFSWHAIAGPLRDFFNRLA